MRLESAKSSIVGWTLVRIASAKYLYIYLVSLSYTIFHRNCKFLAALKKGYGLDIKICCKWYGLDMSRLGDRLFAIYELIC
jgi:hypothetical protein